MATLEAMGDPLQSVVVQRVRPLLLILMGAVTLVLLIVCTNVANLLFVRAAVREKEMAIRSALGAGRLRLVRSLLMESVLLGFLGGAFGLIVAAWGGRLLVSSVPLALVRTVPVGLNGHLLAFAMAISLGAGLILGLLPGLGLSGARLIGSLKEGGQKSAAPARRRIRAGLVVTEIAPSLVLLAGAGLLIRSFQRAHAADPGFAPQHVMAATVSLAESACSKASSVRLFDQQLLQRVRALPGVRAAGESTGLPLETN